jgi:hypothetical protein
MKFKKKRKKKKLFLSNVLQQITSARGGRPYKAHSRDAENCKQVLTSNKSWPHEYFAPDHLLHNNNNKQEQEQEQVHTPRQYSYTTQILGIYLHLYP